MSLKKGDIITKEKLYDGIRVKLRNEKDCESRHNQKNIDKIDYGIITLNDSTNYLNDKDRFYIRTTFILKDGTFYETNVRIFDGVSKKPSEICYDGPDYYIEDILKDLDKLEQKLYEKRGYSY